MLKRSSFGFLAALLCATTIPAAAQTRYASEPWWDTFWSHSQGWGAPNARVMELIQKLDDKKDVLTIVDVGAGNGRNSIAALLKAFETEGPKSTYVVHCIDNSECALDELRKLEHPPWLKLVTQKGDVNAINEALPHADLVLLYGILEYVRDDKLSHVFEIARRALNPGGYLVVVTLVQGEGALEVEGETTRPADFYTMELKKLDGLGFAGEPTVERRPDRHDIGNGFDEDHLHWVYRTVLQNSIQFRE